MIDIADYDRQIQAELDKLNHFKTRRAQRNATIRAVAEARVNGTNVTAVFNTIHNGVKVISQVSYYHRDKQWYAVPEFKKVLDAVTEIMRERRAAEIEAHRQAEVEERHKQRVRLINMGKDKALELLQHMLVEEMPPSQVAGFLATVLKEERTEFNELPTSKNKTELTGADGAPLQVEDVTAVRHNLAAKLAAVAASLAEQAEENDHE